MILNTIQAENQTEDILLSLTKNCETLSEQTHKKPEETLEIRMIKPRETFHFKPPVSIEGSWMIGLTSVEVYNSIFNITKENKKFELYTGHLGSEFFYTEMKDKVTEILGLSDISTEDVIHGQCGPDINKIYRKLSLEEGQTDGYYKLLNTYLRTPVRDFERYLRNLTGLNEDDIQLLLKQYNSKFKTYKVSPGVYTFKDLSEVPSRGFKTEFEIGEKKRPNHKYDKPDSFLIVSDNVTLRTGTILGYEINALRFVENSFLVLS